MFRMIRMELQMRDAFRIPTAAQRSIVVKGGLDEFLQVLVALLAEFSANAFGRANDV